MADEKNIIENIFAFVDQTKFEELMQLSLSNMVRLGVPEYERVQVVLGVSGGKCPECGREWARTHNVVPHIADYFYYRPKCNCLSEKKSDDLKARERENIISDSGIPYEYRESKFESWDYSVSEVTTAAFNNFYAAWKGDRRKGFILYGDVGTGKTQIAASAAIYAAVEERQNVIWIQTSDLVGRLLASKESGIDSTASILNNDVIILDDFDKLAAQSEWTKERVFSIINTIMIEKNKIIILTMNVNAIMELEEKYGIAVVSRLMGLCNLIKFSGQDYRIMRREREAMNKKGGRN